MKPVTRTALIAATAILAAATGFLASRTFFDGASDTQGIDTTAGRSLFTLTLPDSDGKPQALEQWRGKVLVVNFWATWCPPCRTEIPDFSDVSRAFADAPVQFVGVSIDNVTKVREFDTEFDIPYPLLIGTPQTLGLTASLGNTAQALPFTIIFDRTGDIGLIKLGVLKRAELEGKIRALLAP